MAGKTVKQIITRLIGEKDIPDNQEYRHKRISEEEKKVVHRAFNFLTDMELLKILSLIKKEYEITNLESDAVTIEKLRWALYEKGWSV